jgi:hypothetical protein
MLDYAFFVVVGKCDKIMHRFGPVIGAAGHQIFLCF